MSPFRDAGLVAVTLMLACLAVGCASPQGETVQDKRSSVQAMREDALTTLYARVPHLREKVAAAPGYGVFSGIGTHTIYVSTGRGYGVIRNNATGQDTYMRVVKLGGGLGIGAEEVRALVVFTDAKTMNSVITSGWSASGKVGTSATVNDAGGSAVAVVNLPGMDIYRFTKTGVMLSGAIEGAKLWKDGELN